MNILLLESSVSPLDQAEIEHKISLMEQWLDGAKNALIGWLPDLISGLIALFLGLWLVKIVLKVMDKALNKAKTEKTVITFLNSIVKAGLYISLGIAVLAILGVDVSTLIAAVSAAAITVGLALKDSLSNVASGTLIILNKKFKTGDFIETEGIVGEVIKIEMMYTTLRTYDYKEVMIPNSRLTSNNVINHFTLEVRRVEIAVPISYKEDYEKAKEIISSVYQSDERIIKERPNSVHMEVFGDSSVGLVVWVWCSPKNYWSVLFDTRKNIKEALDNAGIEIPFNQLDVHFDNDINQKLNLLKSTSGGN